LLPLLAAAPPAPPSLVTSQCVISKVLVFCSTFHLTFAVARADAASTVSICTAHCKPGAADCQQTRNIRRKNCWMLKLTVHVVTTGI